MSSTNLRGRTIQPAVAATLLGSYAMRLPRPREAAAGYALATGRRTVKPVYHGDVTPIALVDDDPLYCEALAQDLVDRGFAVHNFADGGSFLDAVQQGLDIRVVLLDWTLPAMSGLEVLRTLRQRQVAIPVVFLTGRSRVEFELAALRSGAIDFVDKARGIEVLAPRLRRLIACRCERPEAVCHGELVLHSAMWRAEWRRHDVGLTATEYKVVSKLVAGNGEPVTFRAIYDEVHYQGFQAGTGPRGYEVNVRSMMKKIRRKFAAVDQDFDRIWNVMNVGYLWGSTPKKAAARPVETDADLEHRDASARPTSSSCG